MDRRKGRSGRKSKYAEIEDKLEWIKELASFGFTDTEIAGALGIARSTYFTYKKEHPELDQQIKDGKVIADSGPIKSLLKRANGYDYIEESIEYEPGEDGKSPKIKSIKRTKKHHPPNVMAILAWLHNRRREDWKQRQIELPETPKIPEFENLEDAELIHRITKELKLLK